MERIIREAMARGVWSVEVKFQAFYYIYIAKIAPIDQNMHKMSYKMPKNAWKWLNFGI